MCARYGDQDIRNATVQSDVGEEILIWIFFTVIITIDENSVHLGDVSSIELSTDWYIIIVDNCCVDENKLSYCFRHTCSAIFSVDKEREWSWSSTRMTEDSNSEVHTSSSLSRHIHGRIIPNFDWFY